ncbi:MAG TPA: phage portal protein, partial [Dongiaceae bacterium]|nr:phage portal protein [Dongiaceae bacterium]
MQGNNRKITRVIETYIAKRLFGYGSSDDFSYVDQFTGSKKDIKLLSLYQGLAYRCIDLISEGVAGKYAPFPFTTDNKGKIVTVPNHPFFQLLQDPNPDISFYDLFEGSQTFVEMFGEFFWYMVPGQKTGYDTGVKQIYLLRPDKMNVVVDRATGDVIGYRYTTGNGANKVPFTTDEIIHYMKFNPENPYRGKSALEAAIEYVMTEKEVSKFTRNYFNNNAAMSGVLNVQGKIGREAWNKFVRQWRERYEGVENAGKVALVRDSQVSFTPTSSNLSDMQLDSLKQTTVDQILLMFKVPKGLLGMSQGEGLGRSSVETLEYIFSKWTLDNKLSRMDDTIQKIMVKYYGKVNKGQTLSVGHHNIVPDDKEYLLNYYNQGVDRWITREEIRDQDPTLQNNKIAGAQQLFTTIQQIPLEDAGTQTSSGGSSSSQSSGEKITLVKAKGSKKKVAKDLEYSV